MSTNNQNSHLFFRCTEKEREKIKAKRKRDLNIIKIFNRWYKIKPVKHNTNVCL